MIVCCIIIFTAGEPAPNGAKKYKSATQRLPNSSTIVGSKKKNTCLSLPVFSKNRSKIVITGQ
jgi:hypothetical protein